MGLSASICCQVDIELSPPTPSYWMLVVADRSSGPSTLQYEVELIPDGNYQGFMVWWSLLTRLPSEVHPPDEIVLYSTEVSERGFLLHGQGIELRGRFEDDDFMCGVVEAFSERTDFIPVTCGAVRLEGRGEYPESGLINCERDEVARSE